MVVVMLVVDTASVANCGGIVTRPLSLDAVAVVVLLLSG